MVAIEFEVSMSVVKSYQDGSTIVVQEVRFDPNGPWIDPVHLVKCTACYGPDLGPFDTLVEAQLGYVEHVLLEHIRPTIEAIEAAAEWTVQ